MLADRSISFLLFPITVVMSLCIMLTAGIGISNAQIIHTPSNVALGGGGTANTTGYESLFINPANLFIQEKEYRFQISAGNTGTFFSSPLTRPDLHTYVNLYEQQIDFFSGNAYLINQSQREPLINRNFGINRQLSEHHSRSEVHWLGLHWSRLDKSFAISARTRVGNRFVTGRGYYDDQPLEMEGTLNFDRTLIHQFQTLHEISFGYAESFDFINGLIPGLGQLIIGIAPKFVIGGSYLNAEYSDTYQNNLSTQSGHHRIRSYNHLSTGIFSDASNRLLRGEPHIYPVARRNDLFSPTGFGAGLDFGLTYLITLGDDISVIREEDPRTRKSLRVSFSITDIGFVNYYDTPRELNLNTDTTTVLQLPEISETLFLGYPGEQIQFLEENGSHPMLDTDERSDENFAVLLPTAVHGGILFQINRLKLMGDLSLGFTNNAFNTTRLTSYIGAEVRPLSFLPIRAGMRFARNLDDYYSIGTGIETRYFDLNLGVQLQNRSGGPVNEITGISVAALKFYIP